jgi:ubiquitin-protein ligase
MDPNPHSPANREAAQLYLSDKVAYANKVIEHIKKLYL